VSNKHSILIVDDEKALADTFALALDEDLFSSEVCYDALSALEILREKKFDAILTDVRMPEMDGKEMVEAIRAEGIKNGPIFMMTGFADYTREDLIAAGAVHVFKKPDDIGTIQDVILKKIAS
jgi:CheY-like chemotaxis protein